MFDKKKFISRKTLYASIVVFFFFCFPEMFGCSAGGVDGKLPWVRAQCRLLFKETNVTFTVSLVKGFVPVTSLKHNDNGGRFSTSVEILSNFLKQ